jgi:hypothetical protein
VTWYISNEDPPRSSGVTIKIPPSEEIRQIQPPIIERKTRRKAYGDLVYSINEVNNSLTNSGKKQYSEGDVLDFTEDNRENLGVPRSKRIEHRHDLNELDMESIGLNQDDINKFNSDVYDKKEELENQYLVIRQEIEDIEINIKGIQKKINESNKAISAVKILGDQDLENKINIKKSEYESQIDDLTEQHNIKTEEIASITNDIINIDMVAK